ncbi:Hypothetical protein GLP15_4204 [Giardia lamblia P15]|uniref:Uncharacterized protein n=1 Tax=Giardia intestinalis (strain P15) TaxID=658858 RepID=E1F0K3_GIAIA|nr:Hypothetical protein GLP15_4204 [Giardia lamblia P15]
MTLRPQITITDPNNMGLPALPNIFVEIPGLTTAPIALESCVIFAHGNYISAITAEANLLCQINVEHPVACIATYRYQGCDSLVLGTEDGLLLLYNNIASLIETAQIKGKGARVSPDKYIHVARPSLKTHVSPTINGDNSIYCISFCLCPRYPLLAAGLDNGSCLILSTETFTVLAVLKGSGYGVFQPDYKKANVTCRCSLVYDHFTDLLDHMGYLAQRQIGRQQKRSIHINAPASMILDETVHMDENSLRKLTTEQTFHRIHSMYHSLPKHCASCEQIYGQYLTKAIEVADQISNLPADLYISTELNVSSRPLKKNAKPKPISKEYVTCFGPQANPSIVYLQASFERNSHLGCTPDIASCLCWLIQPSKIVESTVTKTSREFLTLLVGGEDYCICLYHIPVALLALANDSGIVCNCRPHTRFYTSALSTYQNESLIGIDGSRQPSYACNPAECQLEGTMFSPVLMHGFIRAYGDIEGIVQIPLRRKTSGSVCFGIKSALDGYSFYELSLELLSKPMLDLTAYKGHHIPEFLLELELLEQNMLDNSLINIFPKQTAAAQAVTNHSVFYKNIVSTLQEMCLGRLKFFELEYTCESILQRLEYPVLPVHQLDQWIIVNMNRGKYEYQKATPCSSWSFMDVQCTVKSSLIYNVNMLVDCNRYGQVSFYALNDIETLVSNATTATSPDSKGSLILHPRCAVECPEGRPLFACLLDKTVVIAVYDAGIYFFN